MPVPSPYSGWSFYKTVPLSRKCGKHALSSTDGVLSLSDTTACGEDAVEDWRLLPLVSVPSVSAVSTALDTVPANPEVPDGYDRCASMEVWYLNATGTTIQIGQIVTLGRRDRTAEQISVGAAPLFQTTADVTKFPWDTLGVSQTQTFSGEWGRACTDGITDVLVVISDITHNYAIIDLNAGAASSCANYTPIHILQPATVTGSQLRMCYVKQPEAGSADIVKIIAIPGEDDPDDVYYHAILEKWDPATTDYIQIVADVRVWSDTPLTKGVRYVGRYYKEDVWWSSFPIAFVKIVSSSTTDGRYEAIEQFYDAETKTWTNGEVCWYVDANDSAGGSPDGFTGDI